MAAIVSPFRLNPAFVAQYASVEPKFGFDGVGKFVCTRTYSRVKADGESKEEWYEIVERVVNGTYTMQKNWILKSGIEWKDAKAQRSAQEMYDRMFNFKFLPPGRGLWAMGSPITEERGLFTALNNCLAGHETFLTQEYGYKAFKDMVGKHVTVMTANGLWVETMVHCHGQQPLWRITLVWNSCTVHEKVIYATGDHIWFVQTGEEVRQVATKDLDSHMKLACGEDDTSLFYHHNDERNCWWVDSVEATDLVEPVYCVTIPDEVQGVPTNNSFVIQGNILTHNCAFVSTRGIAKPGPERVKPFSFLMDCSMLGVGTGFDVKGAGSFTVHGLDLESPKQTYVIPDTREGWCKSVDLLLTACFEGQPDYAFDYSHVRDKGTPIKGFGGVASGPDPLKKLHDDIRGVCDKNRGQTISITTIVDIMNMIGVCVVAGNVRRCLPKGTIVHTHLGLVPIEEVEPNMFARTSSGYRPISELVHQGTQKLLTIHNQTGQFKCTAKHKIAVMSKPGSSPAYTWKMAKELMPGDHMVFVKNNNVWGCGTLDKDMYKSEPPAIVQAAYAFHGIPTCIKDGKVVELDLEAHDGLIPIEVTCIESTGEEADTYDISVPGANEFVAGPGLLVHNTAEIVFGDPEDDEYVNLKNWAVNPHRGAYGWTSNNSVFAHQGMDYTKTAAVTAANGEPGYAWLDNMRAYGRMNGPPDHKDWRAEGGNPCVPDWTRVMTDQGEVTVKELIGKPFKAKVHGKCYDSHQGFFKTGTKEVFTLRTLEGHTVDLTADHKVLTTNRWIEAQNMEPGDQVVLNNHEENNVLCANFLGLTYKGTFDVYDCTVEDVHRFSANGIIVHNCLEQTLESYEMCCLVEVFPFNCDNKEDFLRTLKFSYLYAKTVTLGQTHWPETNRVMLRNRRIGNSLSGIAQFVTQHGLETLREWCEEGYAEIQKYDTIYSDWFCIPKSIKTTSIKPSGTVSLLAGATSGMHYPISQYYIRRVRVNANSKLLPPLRAAGYKIEPQLIAKAFDPETYKVTETEIDPTTFVVEFVVNAGAGIRAEHEISMWEQLALAAFMQRHWADNQVSCTIKFNQEREGKDIAHALNYYQYQLKGISFLPHSGHGYLQAPYEPIDRETYEATKAGYGVLDFNDAVELPKPDMYCENDTCEMRQ